MIKDEADPKKAAKTTKRRPKKRKTTKVAKRTTKRTTGITEVISTKVTKVVTKVTPKKPKDKPRKTRRYRSKLERRVAKQLRQAKVKWSHEPIRIPYRTPDGKDHYYLPDFVVGDRRKTKEPKLVLECKGFFHSPKDREKLALVKAQHPDVDLCIIFQDHKLQVEPPRGWQGYMNYGEWADNVARLDWSKDGKVRPDWLEPFQAASEAPLQP